MFRIWAVVLALLSWATALRADLIQDNRIIISVQDQKLMLVQDGVRVATYPVSTSKFGVGDNLGTMTTPLGLLQVAKKIGDNAPSGAVFHNRRYTGEVLSPNAPGRDPIVTRIIWLRGLEPANAHAFRRCIYIHGTPQEQVIGRPASYGCIRMKSSDVATLYNQVPIGTLVEIIPDRLPKIRKGAPPAKDLIVAAQPEPAREASSRTSAPPAKGLVAAQTEPAREASSPKGAPPAKGLIAAQAEPVREASSRKGAPPAKALNVAQTEPAREASTQPKPTKEASTPSSAITKAASLAKSAEVTLAALTLTPTHLRSTGD